MVIVIYAKIIDDKNNNIKLDGVYFGGIAEDKQTADKIARECVNTIKGGTILLRTYELTEDHQLPSIMKNAEAIFKKKEQEMITAATILMRQSRRK